MPYLPVIEAGILLPLLFHAVYGIKLALEGKPNVGATPTRATGCTRSSARAGSSPFAFIAFHLYSYWWQKVAGKMDADQFYPALCADLSSTVGGVPLVGALLRARHRGLRVPLRQRPVGLLLLVGHHRLAPLAADERHGLRPRGLAIFFSAPTRSIYFATGDRGRLDLGLGEHEPGARTCADLAPARRGALAPEKK
jgi:hypothetical protein